MLLLYFIVKQFKIENLLKQYSNMDNKMIKKNDKQNIGNKHSTGKKI